jgi:hypothetical protein
VGLRRCAPICSSVSSRTMCVVSIVSPRMPDWRPAKNCWRRAGPAPRSRVRLTLSADEEDEDEDDEEEAAAAAVPPARLAIRDGR